MVNDKQRAIVLVSGGMDSCVSAAIARQNHDLAMLHVRYGQKTQDREERAFRDLVRHFDAKQHLIVDIDHLRRIGGSSLTDPRIQVADAATTRRGVPSSYVPFRNAHLLAIATSWAETIGAKKIFIGVVEQDAAGYPDCTRDFISAFNQAIRCGTKPETEIEIVAPLIDLNKADIVRRGLELKAPFHLTWSCYRASDAACGTCESCALRLAAFRQAGRPDPIAYRSH